MTVTTPGASCEGGAIDTGDTTWVLISTILVMGMLPALAFFEAGLLRSKNTLSLITQIIGGFITLTVMWDLFGYSLTFSTEDWGFVGSPATHVLLLKVPYDDCSIYADNIPTATFAMFMMMFAAITPLLMTGSFAERVKWKAFFTLTVLWEILVFYPVGHWMWGRGWLYKLGARDFAGGIVIHTTAGTGALVLALFMGRRRDFDKYHGEFPPSNLPLAALGACLLWMGWFGFNAGSALTAGPTATSAVVSTQIGGSCSGLVWIFLSWFRGKPSSVAVMNGVIAGLAGITPASGYINSQSTIVLGLILGFSSYFAVHLMKHKLRVDDALDVSSVHGLTGVIGSIFVGFAAENSINPSVGNGLVFGGTHQIWAQIVAVVVSGVYAGVITLALAFIINRTMGLKIDHEEEDRGLDIVEHGEYAYHNLWLAGTEPHYEALSQYEPISSIGYKTPSHNIQR
jgi:Amt family ammonium transporter